MRKVDSWLGPISNQRIALTQSTCASRERHGPQRHVCSEVSCGKSFNRSGDLQRHILSMHGWGRRYECRFPRCDHETTRKDKMKEHCRKMHGQPKGFEQFTSDAESGSAAREATYQKGWSKIEPQHKSFSEPMQSGTGAVDGLYAEHQHLDASELDESRVSALKHLMNSP